MGSRSEAARSGTHCQQQCRAAPVGHPPARGRRASDADRRDRGRPVARGGRSIWGRSSSAFRTGPNGADRPRRSHGRRRDALGLRRGCRAQLVVARPCRSCDERRIAREVALGSRSPSQRRKAARAQHGRGLPWVERDPTGAGPPAAARRFPPAASGHRRTADGDLRAHVRTITGIVARRRAGRQVPRTDLHGPAGRCGDRVLS